VVVFTSGRELEVQDTAGYKIVHIRAGDNLFRSGLRLLREEQNAVVLVDPSFSKNFSRLDGFRQMQFKSSKSLVFVLTDVPLSRFSLTYRQDVTELRLANIVGVLPGKSRKNEYVIFSAHYDHLGIGEPDRNQDSIYNGANDDASGTTAVIMLAKYFSKKGNNQRTLIFAAFTAEEIGEYGSAYFSRQLNPARVSAMFNIEMIGTKSKWGKNSAYITGYEKTDMGSILKKNLAGSPFRFYPDPYPDQQLFYRSDNATLARLGVPAHTVSTSKMDSEKYYHTPGDEIRTLDLANMTQIIRAIAVSSGTIVSGKDTPSRVDAGSLK
jgi:Zn-dependent M28 family amino/carboxypeptidase